jgi:hypothetical protein
MSLSMDMSRRLVPLCQVAAQDGDVGIVTELVSYQLFTSLKFSTKM